MKIFTAISLSVLMLISSIGFSINKHYCIETGTYIYTYFGDDTCDCKVIEDKDSCHHQKGCSQDDENLEVEKGCCDDETVYVQLDSDYSHEITELGGNDMMISTLIYHTIFSDKLAVNDAPNAVNYLAYSAPLYDSDILVITQSFRI